MRLPYNHLPMAMRKVRFAKSFTARVELLFYLSKTENRRDRACNA